MQLEHSVQRLPFRRLHQVIVGDAHRMQRSVQLPLPEIQEGAQARKQRGEIVILPDELLDQGGMVGMW